MPLSIRLLVMGLLIYSPTVLAQDLEGWALTKEEAGVRVYTRTFEGQSFKDSRTLATIQATPDQIVAALVDPANYIRWMEDVKESRLLEALSEAEALVYSHHNAPWPVSDRDLVIRRVVRGAPDGVRRIDLTAEPDYIPEHKGRVRIREMKGSWRITPVGVAESEVEYTLHLNPGGSIPAWMANAKSTDTPFNTVYGLKQMFQ